MATKNSEDDNGNIMQESNIALPLIALKVAQEDLSSIAKNIEGLFLEHSRPSVSKAPLVDGLPASSINQEDDSEHVVTQFYSQLATICSETKFKLMQEAYRLNTNFKRNVEIAIQEEKDLHLKVQLKLATEIRNLHQSIESYKCALQNSDCVVINLLGTLQKKRDQMLLAKSFFRWKIYCENQKREKFMTHIASVHYERKLKQRTFCAWFGVLKANWKEKMELKANVDILEHQKYIVETYEYKIRKLEENLSEAGRNIDLLQNKHKSNEDTVLAALRHGMYSLNTEATNVFCDTSDKPVVEATDKGNFSCPELGTYDLCSDCAWHVKEEAHSCRSFKFTKTPPVNYVTTFEEVKPQTTKVHPSSKLRTLPVMGTMLSSHRTCAKVSECGTSKDDRRKIIIERHIPHAKPISDISASSKLSSRERNPRTPRSAK